MRAAISRATALGLFVIGCGAAEAPPHTHAPVEAPALPRSRREPVRRDLEPLPPRVVASVVSRHRRSLARCHASALDPVRVDVVLEIAKEGAVTNARVSGPSHEVTSCVERDVEGWRFPKSRRESVARFPLVFQPAY